ncbi:hypothetical protein, partial [Barnesiella viscericola]|uniref:hypothetical protein n=1 Tax=Barnesiella viscericola TaxID=397865 RepID=UPI0024B68990
NLENSVFHLPLLSPFTIFPEERRRLGPVNLENSVFHLPLLSPFTIFAIKLKRADFYANHQR